MKKTLVLCLALVLVAFTMCGCGAVLNSVMSGNKYEALSGTWHAVISEPQEEALEFLNAIDAYEAEIAAADLNSLKYAKTVTFNPDKTYAYAFDTQGTIALVREFLDGYFHDLYDARATLNDAYGEDFTGMSKYDFFAFYAELYSYDYYEEMLDDMSSSIYNYAELEQEIRETGTYTIDGKHIMCTITGTTNAEGMEYRIDEDTLTLTYVDATEVYTRAG